SDHSASKSKESAESVFISVICGKPSEDAHLLILPLAPSPMRIYLLLISAGILLLDRFTKFLVIEKIPLYHEIDIIPGFFQLTHLENTGAAFSLFADMQSPWASRGLLVFSLIAVVVIALLLWKYGDSFNLLTICLALFLGGTLGNLRDRMFSGRVTDF